MSGLPLDDDPCPTGCGEQTPRGKLMCGSCWRQVPDDLRREVYRAWRKIESGSLEEGIFEAYREVRDRAIGAIS